MQEIPMATEPIITIKPSITVGPAEAVCPIDGSAESCSIQPPPSDLRSIDTLTTVSLIAFVMPVLVIIFACVKLLLARNDQAKAHAARTLIIRGLIALLLIISIYLIILILAPFTFLNR